MSAAASHISWRSFYHYWSTVSARCACLIAAVALAVRSPAVPTALLAIYAPLSLATLYVGGARIRQRPRPADFVTALRSAAVSLVMLWLIVVKFAGGEFDARGQWLVFGLLVLAETSDFIDGRLARRDGPTRFGAVWDMENDVVFTFALSIMAHVWFGLEGWVVAIGLFRYAYYLLFRFPGDPAVCPGAYKLFAKWVCACVVVALIAATAPFLSTPLKNTLAAVALALQALSFGWDWKLHRLR